MERCKNYLGSACVDGSCPIANAEEYEEYGMDVINFVRTVLITKAAKIVLLKVPITVTLFWVFTTNSQKHGFIK